MEETVRLGTDEQEVDLEMSESFDNDECGDIFDEEDCESADFLLRAVSDLLVLSAVDRPLQLLERPNEGVRGGGVTQRRGFVILLLVLVDASADVSSATPTVPITTTPLGTILSSHVYGYVLKGYSSVGVSSNNAGVSFSSASLTASMESIIELSCWFVSERACSKTVSSANVDVVMMQGGAERRGRRTCAAAREPSAEEDDGSEVKVDMDGGAELGMTGNCSGIQSEGWCVGGSGKVSVNCGFRRPNFLPFSATC